jgi:hypothetical protein
VPHRLLNSMLYLNCIVTRSLHTFFFFFLQSFTVNSFFSLEGYGHSAVTLFINLLMESVTFTVLI